MPSPSKLVIRAFEKPDFKGQPAGTYTVLVNPEKYSHRYEIKFNESPAAGSMNVPLKFDHMPPAKIQFELLFDATGAIPNSPKSLSAEIKKFLSVVYDYQGAIHEPYYLKLTWGDLVFAARLTELSFQYTLFKPDGSPLRARADATFTSYVDPGTMARQEDRESPDLTHLITVRAGDTLPLLCAEIYGDAALYPRVAAFNALTQLRSLRPGMRLVFPPLR